VETLKITQNGVTLGGAVRKAGAVLAIERATPYELELIRAGRFPGVEISTEAVEQELVAQTPPITLAYRESGVAVQIDRDTGRTIEAAPVIVQAIETAPVARTSESGAPTLENQLLDKNAQDVIGVVATTTDRGTLTALRDAEANAKKRSTVLAAIDARIGELEQEAAQSGGAPPA
jgi:hypothetical protein